MPTVLTLANMCSDVYKNNSNGSSHVIGYTRIAREWKEDNFYGAAYFAGQNGVIAFRGSDDLGDWTEANWSIAKDSIPVRQFNSARSCYTDAKKLLNEIECKNLIVTGHSLGGALAQLVAAAEKTNVSSVSFNAPGVSKSTLNNQNFAQICDQNKRILNFRFEGDIVSNFGQHIGAPIKTIRATREQNEKFLSKFPSHDPDPFFSQLEPSTGPVDLAVWGHSMETLILALQESPEKSIRL